jgi:hypothetical protein
MNAWYDGKWTKGNKTIEGKWRYIWETDCFYVVLNSTDPVTGEPRKIKNLYGEQPNFNGWKLVKEQESAND